MRTILAWALVLLCSNSVFALVGTGRSSPFHLDTKPPTVSSIRLDGTFSDNSPSVDFLVTFSESVSPVTGDDFETETSGDVTAVPTVTNVTGSGKRQTVGVNVGVMDGMLGLDLVDANHSIHDGVGYALSGGGSSGLLHEANTVSIVPVAGAVCLILVGLMCLVIGGFVLRRREEKVK